MPSPRPVLTIAVPTHNRAALLERLLKQLEREVRGLEADVLVLVSDNGSTDDTPRVMEDFLAAVPHSRGMRNETDIGPDENFCRCVEAIETPYFWLIGDDDLPVNGAVALIVDILRNHRPPAVYLASGWESDIVDALASAPLNSLDVVSVRADDLLRIMNVFVTFMSGWVVRTEAVRAGALREFAGSYLVQAAWYLDVVCTAARVFHVRTPVILATAGNSGGYGLFSVFASNFPMVVRKIVSEQHDYPKLARAVIRRSAIGYLPGLIFGSRAGGIGNFAPEQNVRRVDSRDAGGRLWKHLVLVPASTWPISAARLPVVAATALSRLIRAIDGARARAHGMRSPSEVRYKRTKCINFAKSLRRYPRT